MSGGAGDWPRVLARSTVAALVAVGVWLVIGLAILGMLGLPVWALL